MSEPRAFRQVWDSQSAFRAFVEAEESNYAILPVIDGAKVTGFRIYDLRSGELEEGNYDKLNEAKDAVTALVLEGTVL
jgi:hypothetical protein